MQPRREQLSRLTSETFDLLVVGGGITGAGIARDAAMRGLTTALIDRHDFAFGTSSRSSCLLHGGLRYLEQGHIGLVREASLEKQTLHGIAPHLAQPLPFIFPVYRKQGRPLWQLTLGVKLYDLLCGGRNFGPSHRWDRERLLQALPDIEEDNLRGAVRYFDAFTSDCRLVIDTLRSADDHGACLTNYMRLDEASRIDDLWHCRVSDSLTETGHEIRAQCVISATGPWGSRSPNSTLPIRPTKGIHIVVDRKRVPVPDAVVMPAGKRILFALPWEKRTIVGTTDTDYSGDPEDVRVSSEDIQYVLKVVNRYFPGVELKSGDIRAAWAGLRPLISEPDSGGNESEISRTHEIVEHRDGWIEVGGGKLTTYRLMAEQAVSRACRKVRSTVPACLTAKQPIPAPDLTGASAVIPPAYSDELVRYFCREEQAMRLTDIMCRRTKWLYYLDRPLEAAAKAADVLAAELAWSAADRDREMATLTALATVPAS